MRNKTNKALLIFNFQDDFTKFRKSHLIKVRTVGRLFHGRVLLLIPDLHTHHWVHVEADQLPGLDHGYAYLRGDVSPSEMKGCRGLSPEMKRVPKPQKQCCNYPGDSLKMQNQNFK